ncbi:MAG: hypothetical protein ACREYA_14785 [Cupriavidus necator]
MTTGTQSLTDDVLAVFRRACEQQQYGVADLLLAALEVMAGQDKDSQQLDEAYLILANCGVPADPCAARDSGPVLQTQADYTVCKQGQTVPAPGRSGEKA